MEMASFIVMLIIVFCVWFKSEINMRRTIMYTVWTFVIFWVNLPTFFVGTEQLKMKYSLLEIPFNLYNLLGVGYVIFANILLTVAGTWIGKSWDKVIYADEKTIKNKFDSFANDASELKIIGRDLDYLANERYADQAKHVTQLKGKAKLLCEQTDDPKLIQLYQKLLKNGNQIRYYTEREGIANLKAQIKVDMHRKEYGLFVTKINYSTAKGFKYNKNTFEINNLESGFLLQAVSREFDRLFDNSLNPVIKCIALDLGGVYFEGDLDDFYDFLENNYEIKMNRNKQDKLNIYDQLTFGEINIEEFIKIKTTTKYKCKSLTKEDWENIVKKWGETWKPDEKLKRLFEYIGTLGVDIIPFSNLDRENGNRYLREFYFPLCCTEHFFSYEQKCCKPTQEAFDKFFEFAKQKANIQFPFQILLIDDQDGNISMAKDMNWNSVKFINGKNSVDDLVKRLKRKGIIPGSFEL